MVLCKCSVWDSRTQRTRRCKLQAVTGKVYCATHAKKCGTKWESPWAKVKDQAMLIGCRARVRALQAEVARLKKLVPKKALKKTTTGAAKPNSTKTIVNALLELLKTQMRITRWDKARGRAEQELKKWHQEGVFTTSRSKRDLIMDTLYRHFQH